MKNKPIPTEIIQLFTSTEAKGYRLIPYELKDNNILKCYGESNSDYSEVVREISVIYNFQIEITETESKELEKGLNQYYEQERSSSANVDFPGANDSNFVNALIGEAENNQASDIHFEPYETSCRIRFRIDGKLIERYILDKKNYPAIVNRIKIMSNLDISEKRLPQDGRILYEKDKRKFDLRVSVLPSIFGEKIVLRLLTRHIDLLDLKNLGFTELQFEDYMKSVFRPNGLILISGPTGSGKSTTLYATLRLLNRKDVNILTAEDPVEYTLPGITQVQLKEEIGLTFGNTLRTFLRQDPDIIMLGEIRDQDTAQMAIRSSLTGHLLLSTIHTNSAWGSVTRLTDMGIHPYLISDTLAACVAQRLIRLLCTHCRKEADMDERFAANLNLDAKHSYYQAVGCEHCFLYRLFGKKKPFMKSFPVDQFLADCIRNGTQDIADYLRQKRITTPERFSFTTAKRRPDVTGRDFARYQ
ncbi:MAG: GspE/PulE family protein [Mangrovibacterium sp.]